MNAHSSPARIGDSILDTIGGTPLVRLSRIGAGLRPQLIAKLEAFNPGGSIKDRVAVALIEAAERDGKLRPGGTIVEPTSGNTGTGLAIAARLKGYQVMAVMPDKMSREKIDLLRAYGAEVVLHGTIWDEANERAKELVAERGLTYVHPFDDLDLIAGQGTLGLEIYEDYPEVDVIVVPIGGGGLISGVSMAVKGLKPSVKIIGVESSGAPGMLESVRADHVVTLPTVDCIIDGLRVKRVGENNFAVVRKFVDEIVTLPDEEIFDALRWTMGHCKLVVEGAAAAPIAALRRGLITAPAGSKVVCVLSGGNVNLDQLKGLRWN